MTTRLQRDFGTATNNKIFTISVWIKKQKVNNTHVVLCGSGSSHARPTPEFLVGSSGKISFYSYNGSGYDVQLQTVARLRDVNGWYHIVMAVDTTQSTASNRVKFYVNGVQQTSFSPENYPSQNFVLGMNNNTPHCIGGSTSGGYGGGNELCLMSHYHFADGTAYTPSTFGETDSTTGEWKLITNPTFTLGNNGFTILKDGNTITDQSTNSNNFTLGTGTLTKTEDCPSNVFVTWNPLGSNRDVTFSNGNCTATYGTSGTRDMVASTLGAVNGKYYWETTIQGSQSANNAVLGISLSGWNTGYAIVGETNYAWGFRGYDGAVYNNNSSVGGTWSTFTNGDIIGVAVNLDNEQGGLNKLYFSKNGTWLNGADPSNFTSTTGVVGITKPENGPSGFLFPAISDAGSTATPQFITNFGNGFFGTTAVASAGTNASNNGIFEYDVPTGFTALTTKGLNL